MSVSVSRLDKNGEDKSSTPPWWKESSRIHQPPKGCLILWGMLLSWGLREGFSIGKLGTHCWQRLGQPLWDILVLNPCIVSATITMDTSSWSIKDVLGWQVKEANWQRPLCSECPSLYIRMGGKHSLHTVITLRGPSVYLFLDLLVPSPQYCFFPRFLTIKGNH